MQIKEKQKELQICSDSEFYILLVKKKQTDKL